ncbi:MAG: T9SS type A sorting domain-containing protein [Flavobacteriales bacterium]|jgi:uncharacterized delta-60 repeat protein
MKHIVLAVLIGICQFAQAQVLGIDYSFQAVTPDGVVNKILVLPDGKILIGGAFYNYAGTQVHCLVRLHPDGTLDNTWNPGAFGLNGTINDMELMPDGKIMIGGIIISYNGVSCGNLVRLNADGTRDATFIVPFGAINGAVLQLELHMDNTVVAAGEFQHCYGIGQPHIARFHDDGSLDTTFNIGIGFYATVRGLKVMPDLRILAVGDFTLFNVTTCMRMARLHADGTYDTTFVADPGLEGTLAHGRSVDIQPDGKILIAGSFSHHAGTPANDLIRLNTDGSRDQSFVSPFSPWATVNAVKVLPDGKIVAGGEFINGFYWPSIPAPARFVRLNADGSWDSTFPLTSGFTPEPSGGAFIKDMVVQSDGRILVGGMFEACDMETQYKNLIRLNTEMTVGLPEATEHPGLQIYYDHLTDEVVIYAQDLPPITELALYSAAGQLMYQQRITSTSNSLIRFRPTVNTGVYFVRVWYTTGTLAGKLMIP